MVIKRRNKLFIVFKDRDELFKSYSFDECRFWVEENGGFNESRKKIKEIACKVG